MVHLDSAVNYLSLKWEHHRKLVVVWVALSSNPTIQNNANSLKSLVSGGKASKENELSN